MQHDQKPRLAQHIFKESIALVHHGQTSQWWPQLTSISSCYDVG
jgi:hypothetical protein